MSRILPAPLENSNSKNSEILRKLKNLYCVVGGEDKIQLIVCDTEEPGMSHLNVFKSARKKLLSNDGKKLGKQLKNSFKLFKSPLINYKVKGKYKERNDAITLVESHGENEETEAQSHIDNLISFQILPGSTSKCSSPTSIETMITTENSSLNENLDNCQNKINFRCYEPNSDRPSTICGEEKLLNIKYTPGSAKNSSILIKTDLDVKFNDSCSVNRFAHPVPRSAVSHQHHPINCYVTLPDERVVRFQHCFHFFNEAPPQKSVSLLLNSILEESDIIRGTELCRKYLSSDYSTKLERSTKKKKRWHSETSRYYCDIALRKNGMFGDCKLSDLENSLGSSKTCTVIVRPKDLRIYPNQPRDARTYDAFYQLELSALDESGSNTNLFTNLTASTSEDDSGADVETPSSDFDGSSNECTELVEVKYFQLSLSIVLALVLHAVQSISQLMLEIFPVTEPHSSPW